MKRIMILLITAVLLGLGGCGSQEQPAATEPEIVTEETVPETEETVPETVPRTMEEYTYMEVGVLYPYTTATHADRTIPTVAEAMVTSYEIFESAEGFPPKEGYEWRVVKMQIRYFDDNTVNYGCSIAPIFDDYYNSQLYNDTSDLLEATEEYHIYDGTVIYNGKQMETYCYWYYDQWADWFCPDGVHLELKCYEQWAFLVPVGYDGCMAGLADSRFDWYEGTCLTDYDPAQFLLFRAA